MKNNQLGPLERAGSAIALSAKLWGRQAAEKGLAAWRPESYLCPLVHHQASEAAHHCYPQPTAPHTAAPAASEPSKTSWSSHHQHLPTVQEGKDAQDGLPALPPWPGGMASSILSISSLGKFQGCPTQPGTARIK